MYVYYVSGTILWLGDLVVNQINQDPIFMKLISNSICNSQCIYWRLAPIHIIWISFQRSRWWKSYLGISLSFIDAVALKITRLFSDPVLCFWKGRVSLCLSHMFLLFLGNSLLILFYFPLFLRRSCEWVWGGGQGRGVEIAQTQPRYDPTD